MPLPVVAIVGRPNVGKSSLLNMLAGKRISIVEPTAGVTRDRVQTTCQYGGNYFELVDTGGYGIVDRDDLGEQVERQIACAIQEAALVLFVVDVRDGLMPLDQAVADWLRGKERPVLLLANKADTPGKGFEIADFHKLGFGEPVPVSALHRRGLDVVRDWIVTHLPAGYATGDPGEPEIKIAIVGRRNAGKSTFINALAGQERVIVSEIPGTTRDAIDVRFEHDGKSFLAIDTAGLRKKSKVADDIEYYSFHRAELSIHRADVVLFMIDATSPVSQVDKRLGGYISEQMKPCIVVINKWDLAKEIASTEEYGDYLLKVLPGLHHAPVAFVTAREGRNIKSVIDLAATMFKQARTRVTTAQLNSVLERVMNENVPKPKRGTGTIKVLYMTQVAVCPPTLVLFVNDPSRVTAGFERFLIGRLRDMLPFSEVPIRLVYRGRREMETVRGTSGRGRRR